MGDRTEVAAAPGGDQVEAARDWLRALGVEPEVDSVRQSPASPGAVVQDRSRSGWSRSDRHRADPAQRRPGRVEVDPVDEVEDDIADADAGGAGAGRTGKTGRRSATGSADPDADPEEVARQIVLRKLAAQARTRTELERALRQRDVPVEASAAVLDRMDEVGLVDDAAFARDWVASRQQRRHLSRSALRRELQAKGVDRELIDDALTDVEVSDEHRAALDLATRRARSMPSLTREVAYRRLAGVLARRGFSSSVSAQVLGEVLTGWGEPTDGADDAADEAG